MYVIKPVNTPPHNVSIIEIVYVQLLKIAIFVKSNTAYTRAPRINPFLNESINFFDLIDGRIQKIIINARAI
jgi:hypothetical protein